MTDHAGTLELITSYETIAREFTLHELDATNENFGLEHLPGEGESGCIRLEGNLEMSGFRQASEGIMFYGLVNVFHFCSFLPRTKFVVQFL